MKPSTSKNKQEIVKQEAARQKQVALSNGKCVEEIDEAKNSILENINFIKTCVHHKAFMAHMPSDADLVKIQKIYLNVQSINGIKTGR